MHYKKKEVKNKNEKNTNFNFNEYKNNIIHSILIPIFKI